MRVMAMTKGISPLIAAVLLVAFTMSIAGLMAAWATSFTQSRLASLDCATAIDITALSFSNENITIRVRNTDTSFTLQNLTMSVIYSDVALNRESIFIANTNFTDDGLVRVEVAAKDSLAPGDATSAKINTFSTMTPKSVEVISVNCKQPSGRNF